jgi:pyridoxal biosynthesis lyase PdxS
LLAVLQMIRDIKAAVTIPVMAKARIGHFVEAQILEALGIDYIDESEVGAALRWVVQGVEGGV